MRIRKTRNLAMTLAVFVAGAGLFSAILPDAARAQSGATSLTFSPAPAGRTHHFPAGGALRFELRELIEHPFYAWPRTLLTYPVDFSAVAVQADQLTLVNLENGRAEPFQLSEVRAENGRLRFAHVHFFSDLPSGATRRFELKLGGRTPAAQRMEARREEQSIVLDTGVTRVRIPASREVWGDAPGPVMQLGWGDRWYGSSRVVSPHRRLKRIVTEAGEAGPIFVDYTVVYEFERGGRYTARLRAIRGYEFILMREEMEGFGSGEGAYFETSWTGFDPTHRQAPNHPLLRARKLIPPGFDTTKRPPYAAHNWDRIDRPVRDDHHGVWQSFFPDNELYFRLGVHQTWVSYTTLNSANFWDERTNDAIGIFIDRNDGWDDREYAIYGSSHTLQVRYYYQDGRLSWRWPLAAGTRSTALLAYDHAKDIRAVEENADLYRQVDGGYFLGHLAHTSHTQYLQTHYGYLGLDYLKEYVLEYGPEKRRQKNLFPDGKLKSADELEKTIFNYQFFREAGTHGARVDTGHSAVFTRIVYTQVSDAYVRFYEQMTPKQRQRITAILLLMGYLCASEEFMPMRNMFGGNPNFHSDTKSVVGLMAYLFPEHPHAREFADVYEKYLDLATRYFVRPTKDEWGALGGRWAENLGGYVWVAWRPLLRAASVTRDHFDGRNRVAKPGAVELGDWLVNAVGAPAPPIERRREGEEAPPAASESQAAPTRVYPPQGAHATRRAPPKDVWLLGSLLRNYAPLTAEHLMWTARPDARSSMSGDGDPWPPLVFGAENRGTNPHLKSSKYTGYGVVLRAAVDTPDELSVHLQQIDDGPNYRWGSAAEGGNGTLYFYAGGKSYSHNGTEDAGDRRTQDTDINTSFGVWRDADQGFKAVGKNFLTRPLYDLDGAQFAEIRAREGRKEAYSWPDYIGRSVLLAGADYFVLYDDVYSGQVRTRFSWFTGASDPMPNFHWVRGGQSGNRGGRSPGAGTVKLDTGATKGVWVEGSNDSMVVVTHKDGLKVEPTVYGATVRGPGLEAFEDQVFRDADGVDYAEGGVSFSGKAGIVRRRGGRTEMAIFNGAKIEAAGLRLAVSNPELGISATFEQPGEVRGLTYAEQPGVLTIAWAGARPSGAIYVDGERQGAAAEGDSFRVNIPAGRHTWQFTAGLPVPNAPAVLRTENVAGGARVFFTPRAGAESYRVELSADNGASWKAAGTATASPHTLSGLTNGQKVHVRVVALNAQRESRPGDEYPLYVSNAPPPAPDGLVTRIERNKVNLSWGETLGASEYRLYRRKKGEGDFALVYKGLARGFVDAAPGVIAAFTAPGFYGERRAGVEPHTVYEYAVASANGNGEGRRSTLVDTDPASWRNWDPTNWERFKYEFINLGYRDGMYVIEPNNPGRVRYIQ
jgi:hypothetical protein